MDDKNNKAEEEGDDCAVCVVPEMPLKMHTPGNVAKQQQLHYTPTGIRAVTRARKIGDAPRFCLLGPFFDAWMSHLVRPKNGHLPSLSVHIASDRPQQPKDVLCSGAIKGRHVAMEWVAMNYRSDQGDDDISPGQARSGVGTSGVSWVTYHMVRVMQGMAAAKTLRTTTWQPPPIIKYKKQWRYAVCVSGLSYLAVRRAGSLRCSPWRA